MHLLLDPYKLITEVIMVCKCLGSSHENSTRIPDNRGRDGWMASPTQRTWFEQAPGDGEGQGSLAAAVRGVAESDTAERLSNGNPNLLERRSGFQQTGQ